MGSGQGGGYSRPHSNIAENIKNLSRKYPLDINGRFGHKGIGHSQVIYTEKPLETAREFFYKLGLGAKTKSLRNGAVLIRAFPDGSHVVFRAKSKHGSPAVEIAPDQNADNRYKIHHLQTNIEREEAE